MHWDEIITLTHQADSGWAIPHARRLLSMTNLIAEDRSYDTQVIAWAALLHDWGALAQLFRKADFLDFLGTVGMAREFAWGPPDLAAVAKRIRSRMDGIRGRFTLPVARHMAEARLAEMEIFLASLQEEGLGTI